MIIVFTVKIINLLYLFFLKFFHCVRKFLLKKHVIKWTLLVDGLLGFLWIEFKVMGQLIGLVSVGVTTH